MTFALVCVNDSVYGGVYYCAAFTTSGAQPTWAKLTVTGLADLRLTHMGVDPDDPLNKQYVAALDPADTDGVILYYRNGGNWTEILDAASGRAVAGVADIEYKLSWLYADQTVSGAVYTCLYNDDSAQRTLYVLKSLDYGTSWTAHAVSAGTRGQASVYAVGDTIWCMYQYGLGARAYLGYSANGGAAFTVASQLMGSNGQSTGNMDQYNPTVLYHGWYNGDTASLIKSTYAGGAITSSILDTQFASASNVLFESTGRIVALDPDTNTAYTDNAFTTHTDVTTDDNNWFCSIRSQNNSDSDIMRGGSTDSVVGCLSSETDTTFTDRSGANHGGAPFANSLPGAGETSWYGVWFGDSPASYGAYVYADEQGDITDIPDPDNLGIPMFGDRSSWRDYDADDDGAGTPLADYHAQDIQEDTPQRHAPWSVPGPAAGLGIVSDGSKWIVTTDEIAYEGDLPSLFDYELEHRFIITAHRGDINAVDGYPENTLAACLEAARKGAQRVECDVRLSSDGVWYLMHDATVDRTTDGAGNIVGKTAAQIDALNIDAGFGYDAARHAGLYNPPTLDSVLDALNPYGVSMQIENYAGAGTYDTLIALIVAAGYRYRVVLNAQSQAEATEIDGIDNRIPIMGAVGETGWAEIDVVQYRYGDPTINDPTEAVVLAAAPRPVSVYVSTLDYGTYDEAVVAREVYDRGARYFTTNDINSALDEWAMINVLDYLTLGEISDVDLTGLGDGDSLLYDLASTTWVPGTPVISLALDDLSDVNTAGVADGQAILYDVGTATWLPGDAGVASTTLHGHVINEDHSAECDGLEDEFATSLDFLAGTTAVYLNGLRQRLDTHYTEDATLDGVTFVTAPEAGDELVIDYLISYADWLIYTAGLLDSESVQMADSDGEILNDSA